jgi:tetratricopeptide (TPR) repeat protein
MMGRDPSGRSAAAAVPAIGDPVEAALGLRAENRLEDALQVLSRSRDLTADGFTLRGDLQLELGRFHDAIESYAEVIQLDRDNTYAYYQLALCLSQMKRWEEAAEILRKLLAYDSHRDPVRIGLGECLLRLNRLEEALACFDQCWSEGARAQAWFGKAVALQLLRRFDEAEGMYERLLALDPKVEEALTNLIAMSLEVFDLDRIQRYSTRLLGLRPRSLVALQGMTLVTLERGEHDSAGRYFARLNEVRSGPQAPAEEHPFAAEYCLTAEVVERLAQIQNRLSPPRGTRNLASGRR